MRGQRAAARLKAYDIRSTVPDHLNAEPAPQVGAAFARLSGAGLVAVGHDYAPGANSAAQGAAPVGRNTGLAEIGTLLETGLSEYHGPAGIM